jgi:hypothetical protein
VGVVSDRAWVAGRVKLPVGPLFCVIDGPTRGRAWSASAARVELRYLALKAGVRRRFAPDQLRHAHAVELMHEGIPLALIQRQLGHSHLSTTRTYLEGINNEEIISTVHARRAPMMHASAGLALEQAVAGARPALPHPIPCSPAKQQPHPTDAASPLRQRGAAGRSSSR